MESKGRLLWGVRKQRSRDNGQWQMNKNKIHVNYKNSKLIKLINKIYIHTINYIYIYMEVDSDNKTHIHKQN